MKEKKYRLPQQGNTTQCHLAEVHYCDALFQTEHCLSLNSITTRGGILRE